MAIVRWVVKRKMMLSGAIVFCLSFLALLPFSVAQKGPERFEASIVKYEREDSLYNVPDHPIVFTGSSSITKWKLTLKRDMMPMPVIDRGFGGSTLPAVLFYADRVILRYHPDIVVLYAGENDLANDKAKPENVITSMKAFITYMQKYLPDTKVFYLSIKPSVKRWKYWPKMARANDLLKELIDETPNFEFVDVASPMLNPDGCVKKNIFIHDNLHMNDKGFEIWTEVLKPVLLRAYKVSELTK